MLPVQRRLLLSLVPVLALAGCPEPVVENAGDPDQLDEGASVRGVMGENPDTMPAAAGPGPADQVASGAIPDADLDPVHTQESLADGALLKGTLGCEECAGSLLVRVLPPPPSADAAEEDEGIVLITQKSFEAPGPFEIRVPKDRSAVVLQVVEDADESGKPSAGERMGIVIDGPITVADVVEGIELTVGVFPQMGNAPAAEGLPPGTEPPGGGPGGTPPAAGPTEDGEAPPPDAITNGLPPATGAQTADSPPPALDTPALPAGNAAGEADGDAPAGDAP